MRSHIPIFIAALFLQSCSQPHVDGAPVQVNLASDATEKVLREALLRLKDGQLKQPIVVKVGNEEMFSIGWPSDLNRVGTNYDEDSLLDLANVQLLSVNGGSPLYSYCFTEDHAQYATNFCTRTLIQAMKDQVARDKKGGPRPA